MKRTSLKARTGLALLTLSVPAFLTGCGGSTSSNQDVTSLSELDWHTTATPDIDALNQCAAKAGVTLDRQVAPVASYMPKVLQQVSSKTLPDVLMLDLSQVQQVAATGALTPLNDLNVSTDGFSQGVLQGGTYNGKVYGLAPAVNTLALFYNKDLLAKAGVQPPSTWDELKAAAAKLTSGGQYGLAFSANASAEGTATFLPFMWSNGGDERNIATPETAEALQLWTDLVKSGSASSSVLNWTEADAGDQFIAGKAAMMVNGPWEISALDKHPDLNYGVVNIPVKSHSNTAVALLGGVAWTVPQSGNKAKQAKAAEVVACMNSDEKQRAIAKGFNYSPTKTTLAAQFASENPNLAVFTNLIKTARARTGELGADWPKAEAKIYTAIQTALTGKASPADGLNQAQNNG